MNAIWKLHAIPVVLAIALSLAGCPDAETEKQSQAWERVSRKYCQELTLAGVPQRIDGDLAEAEKILRAVDGWGAKEDASDKQCRAALRRVHQAGFELASVAALADALWFAAISREGEHYRDHLSLGHQFGLKRLRDLFSAFDTCRAESLTQLADQTAAVRKVIAARLKQATERCGTKFLAK